MLSFSVIGKKLLQKMGNCEKILYFEMFKAWIRRLIPANQFSESDILKSYRPIFIIFFTLG